MSALTMEDGDKVTIEFDDAEEMFEIVCLKGRVKITQTAGFEVGTGFVEENDPEENEFKIIYESE